jgi:hypothetical protein
VIDQGLSQFGNARLLHEVLGVVGIGALHASQRQLTADRDNRTDREAWSLRLEEPEIVLHDRPPAPMEVRLGHHQDYRLYPRGGPAQELELAGTELRTGFNHEQQGVGEGQCLQRQLRMT